MRSEYYLTEVKCEVVGLLEFCDMRQNSFKTNTVKLLLLLIVVVLGSCAKIGYKYSGTKIPLTKTSIEKLNGHYENWPSGDPIDNSGPLDLWSVAADGHY